MDSTSEIEKESDMEEEDQTNYPPFRWIQQDANSPIIKLEPHTTNEKLGKWQLYYM